MSHVFISYSKKNRDYARKLADHLLSLGFDVWIDDRIDYGADWWRTIVRAIRNASAFIVIMTDESDASEWVQREVTIADKQQIPPFPVWLSGDFHKSENWTIYVRTQYANVTDGSLPRNDFYNRLAQSAPRSSVLGTNVTPSGAEPVTSISDPYLAQEVASPPLPETATFPIVPTTRRTKGMLFRIIAIWLVIILIVAFLVTIAFAVASSFNLWSRPTPTVTANQQLLENPTDVLTSTPKALSSFTPAPIPILSSTEVESTIQGEMNVAQTDIANTQSAVTSLETANAVATDAHDSVDKTGTATQWTPTPTIDFRATALMHITETQVAVVQTVLDQTAIASSWTLTPTPTTVYCEKLSSRIYVGIVARVVSDGALLRLRNMPSTSAEQIGQLKPRETFVILDGPECKDGLLWWQVNYNGLVGWTAEGFSDEYWIEPLPIPTLTPANLCPGAINSRLNLGANGYVNYDLGLSLRSDHGGKGIILERLYFGTEFYVIDGPICDSLSNWWKVELKDGRNGWLSEGSDYYLIAPISLNQAILPKKYNSSCPNAVTPSLLIGQQGRINTESVFFFRSEGARNQMEALPLNTIVQVLGGYVCEGENNVVRWYIRVVDGPRSGYEGWISETNAYTRFIDVIKN